MLLLSSKLEIRYRLHYVYGILRIGRLGYGFAKID